MLTLTDYVKTERLLREKLEGVGIDDFLRDF